MLKKGLRKKLCKQYLTTLDKAKITVSNAELSLTLSAAASVKATLDLDNSTMDFKLMNVDDNSQGYEIKGISIANTNGFGTLRFLARKKGSSVTWKPTLSDVKVYHTK